MQAPKTVLNVIFMNIFQPLSLTFRIKKAVKCTFKNMQMTSCMIG